MQNKIPAPFNAFLTKRMALIEFYCVNSFKSNSAIGLYLGLAEAGTGRGINGDGAAALIITHDDGYVGKTTTSLAF